MPLQSNTFGIIKFIIIFGVVLAFVFISLYFFDKKNESGLPPVEDNGLVKNQNFAKAENLLTAREYSKSLEEYGAALTESDSLEEEMFIKYRIAQATRYSGDNPRAIELFKDLITNPKYSDTSLDQAKASAVVSLAAIYYQTHDDQLTEMVFTEEPFVSMRKPEDSDPDISYRRLFEYASSLYSPPNLLAESRTGLWYALQVYNLKKGELSIEEGKILLDYEMKAKEKLASIEEHMDDPGAYYEDSMESTLPILLRFKAIIMGLLFVSGDTSVGDPENVFLESMILPQPDWVRSQTKYSYAVFLADTYGTERSEQISELLSDFYRPPFGTEFNWRTWLINEKKNPSIGNKEALLLLAQVDPQFKALLEELGWIFDK